MVNRHKPYGIYERVIKRPLDLILASVAFVVLLPFLVIIALLVRVNLGSPVVFNQERPGRVDPKTGREHIFKMYKFRSMTDGRDEEGNLLPDDNRLTKFGRLLRSSSMDELLELINIIKGDMAIVGPRPLLVEYLPYYTEEERHRHDVRPGLTGLAQVNGRNAISWDEKLAYDINYISKITFLNDVKIVLKTVAKTVKRSDVQIGSSFKAGKFIDQRKKRMKHKVEKKYDSVSLRDFNEEDIGKKIEWINNPANNAFLHYEIPLEYEKTLNWYRNKDNSRRVDCIIEYESCPVGIIGLLAIDNISRKAEYYITLGSTEHKRKSISTKATMLILEYAFVDLNLNKVYLTVDEDNVAACGLYEKVGFVCEGVFEEEQERRGELITRKRYAYLKRDWNDRWREK